MRQGRAGVVAFLLLVLIASACDAARENPASGVAQSERASVQFSDVTAADWFCEDVDFVSKHGLMNGTGAARFSPMEHTTRGMIVTVLWRMEGSPIEGTNAFQDVEPGAYYIDAVNWASAHQIVNGYSREVFAPHDVITREQIITILYRYAMYKGCNITGTGSLKTYEDSSSISDFAVNAFRWGCGKGIVTGTSENTLAPLDPVQRCQAAALIHRYEQMFSQSETSSSAEPSPLPSATPDNPPSQKNDADQDAAPSSQTPNPSGEIENTCPRLIVVSKETAAGQEAQVQILIQNNPGILGMTLSVYYDEASCTMKEVTTGEALEGILDLTPSNTLGSGMRLVWDGIDIGQEDVKDGVIANLTFSIADDAPAGKLPITVRCYDGDAVDRNLQGVPLQIEDGYIQVR